MARRGRGAELNALRQKKKDEQTGSTTNKSQSSVSSNKNGGGRTGGLTRQQVQQKVSRSAGYTSSGKAKQPAQTQKTNPYATTRNIVNRDTPNVPERATRTSNRINSSNTRGREQAPIDRRQTAATAAEMRRAQENERLSRTSTGRQMLEQRENEKKAKAQTAEEWKDVKKLSTAEQQEWFTKKAQDAQERNALKNNTKVDKGTDNLATSAFKSMGLGAKSAGSSLLGRLERGSLNDTYESAKFKFDAMREGKSESEAQAIGDSKAQKRQEQRLAGLRAITKAAQERTEQIQEEEEAKDKHKINIGGETLSPRKMAVGAASITGQRIADTVAMGPYSLLGMGARVLEDETNSGKEKTDRLKKRLADSGQFSQEELDREFDKIDRRTTANAYASAGIEMLSELMFSGVGLSKRYLPEGATGLLDRTIGKLFGNVGRSAVGRVALGIGEETAEEWIGNPIQAAISNKLTGNRLQGLQEESIRRTYQGQAQSLKEAHATAADINSQAFLDRAKEVYKESGANEEEASRIAELARDYFNADLTGDSETAQQKLQQITDILAGGENDLRDKWTLRDALEVAGEMVLSVGAEATPGAISTAQIGGQYKANYGIEGVRKLAKVVENLDTDKTHQAAAIVDDIDKGKDISNTQVAMLMEWSNAAAQKAQDREITRDQVVQRKMRDESLFVPIVDSEYNLAPATAERFEAITERVADLAQDYMGVKMSDRDAYAIGDVVAAYQTGTISAEQMNEINMENPENRAVFERATGINLDQYTVKDRKGNVNVAASNTAMQEDLFAKAADNYMKSARLEQENWNDVARGQAYEELTSNMDGMGGVGIQRVLESVDPRNRDDFMLAGSVARRVYEHARATNDDWNTVKRDFTQAFGADMNESMKYVFDMAKQAKAIAENKYYGKQVSPKSSIGDTVVAEGKFTNESARELKGSEIGVLTSIASELGIDVIMSDDLERNENGRYMSGKRTIMLNAANTMGENLEAIFSHEVTHHLAAYAPDEYIKLSRFVMDRWYKANPDEYNAEIKRIQKLYKDVKNQELSPEEALEELIADGSRDFWQDGELINSVTTEEPSLAKSIINSIKSFLGKLRNILASGSITDDNIRDGFFAEIDAYDEAYRLWLNAYKAARSDSARQAIYEWQDKAFDEARNSVAEEKWERGEKLSQAKFNSFYSAHKLNYGASQKGDLQETIDSIKANGFTSNTALSNVVPASINDYVGEKPNYTQGLYGARKGDTVLLVPKPYLDQKNDTVKNGFKPRDYEIVEVERDFQPYYELYSKAYDENEARFSISEPVERVKDLIAVHNLKPDDIRNTFELGGFPMPSIAVTKDSMGHDLYGDITLMFHSDTIDPKRSRDNQVFGGDAWTPTFPPVAKKINRKVADRVDQKLRDILGLSTTDYTLGDLRLPALDDDNLTNSLRYNDPYDAFKNDEVFQIAYLKNAKNFDVAVPTKEGNIRGLNKQALEFLDDRLPELTHNDIYDTVDHTMEYEPAVREARKAYYEAKGGTKLKALSKMLDEKMGYSDVLTRLEATIKFRKEGVPEVTDRDALDSILKEHVDEEGFKNWIDNLFEGIVEKTGIRNGKDMFTASGNRRSWESLHDPVTLENVVKVMRTELAAGGNGLFGSNPKGAAQKNYKSLDEIRSDESRLQSLPEEEYNAQSDQAVGKLAEVSQAIAEHNPKRFDNNFGFGAALDVGSYVAEILNSTRNRSTIQRKLKEDYWLDVTDDQMDDLMEAIEAIANLPTGYFEAKPRRAVGFDEVKAAIIPASTDEDIKQGFNERGIQMYEYDPDVEGDRTEKVNEAATEQDLRFSIAVDLDDQYMSAVNSGNMDEAQRLVDEAAKRAGYGAEPYYHGTLNTNFTAFDKERSGANYRGMSLYGKGLYFTKDRDRAVKWGKKPGYRDERVRVIGAYLNLQNPFDPNKNISEEMLAEYNKISDSPFKRKEMNGGLMIEMLNGITDDPSYSTEFLKKYGYDGVADEVGNQYVVFEPEQIKSSDPVTYAEDGSVIPLSERFDPNNNDIRYSLPTQDSDGNILTDGQMDYFKNSQARDEQGRLVPVYHTTNKGGFTIFDPMRSDDHRSLFFASNWDVSQTYGNYANSRFYQFDINNLDDVEKYLDAYGPDFYVLTKDEFKRAGGYEADFVDFENEGPQYRFDAIQKKWKSSNRASETRTFLFKSYIEDVENGDIDPDDYVVIVGVPDYSPDNRSYSDTWILANSPNELVSELKNHFLAQQNTYSGASTVGTQHGYYKCYLNLENPLIIDAQGQNWNDISDPNAVKFWIRKLIGSDRKPNGLYGVMFDGPLGEYREGTPEELSDLYNGSISGLIDEYDISIGANSFTIDRNTGEQIYGESSGNTRYWAERAEAEGYDGVIFRNLLDIGGKSEFDGIDEYSDIYIAFSSNQVKDINNENPTENPDIRYSIPPEDETMNYAQTNADTTDNLWYTDPVMHEGAIRYSMSKKDFINGTTDKWNPAWRTEGRVLKEKSVEKDIRNVIMGAMRDSDTNAKYRQKVVKDTMLVARKAFDYMKSDEHTKAAALLYDHAHSIIEDLEFFGNQDESEFQRYKELREYLRTTKITVPEDKRSDIDYEAFRRKNFHKILLGNGGIAPDKVWDDLHYMWPEAFPEDIKGDIPGIMLQIENALDIYQPYAEAYSSEQCEAFAGDIANSLWDIIYEGEEYKSLADKYDDKAKAMKLRHQEAMRKVKENYKEKLTKQALEAKRKQYAMLDRQKERYEEKLDQQKARLNARQGKALGKQKARYEKEISRLKENRKNADAKRKARREHRQLYDRILKEHKDLTHRLLNPSKDKAKNIPEQLRQPLAQMLYCFDLEKERSKKLEEMYMIPTRSQLNFRQLKDAMGQVVKEDPTAYEMSDIHKYLEGKMTDLADRVDGKSIDALDEADMQIVKDLLSGLNKAIKEGQQLEIDGENYQKQVQCDKVYEGAVEHQKIYGKAKTYGGARQIVDNIVNMGELTPIYFFKGIPGMYDMYRQLRTGFDEYVRNENDIIDKIADILAPYYKSNRKGQRVQGSEIEDWRHAESAETFDLISGDQTITLTIAQRMALYCLAKRSQAQGHMYSENGGIVASEITAGSKITKAKESVKGKIVEQKPVILTPADVDNIIASLTDDQVQIAEKLQDLMSKDMSVLGNRASMKLTGIEMYKEDNYFPIKVQGDSRPTDIDNIGIREKIRNPGFSNPLVENAQNPIIVDDIFTVVASHCNEMNQYASYAVPITSFMKVYNGSVLDENGKSVKVKTLIRQTYGDKAITYIENFIDDINGNSFKRQGGLDDVLDKALGQAKKAAVFANLRVALQQPTAIVRAFAVINPKYFAGVKPSPKATQEMIEHCPIAQWKAWGYYDTHFGRDIEDVMMGKNIPNKMDYLMSEIYGALDNMTWGMIWQAVKNEVKATNKGIDENSQEFWDLCNERASYVFDTTQVVDSPFHRSNDMRSKNGLVKQLTSFQAEPTLSFNVLRQGLVDAIEAVKTGNKSKASKVLIRTLTVWTIQALTVALAQSFVDALRRKGKTDKDDDEDKMLTWWQEIAKYFMRNFTDDFADDMNAINNIYFAKDVVPPILNAIKGEYVFGQQNLTFQWVDTLTNGIEQCRKKWEKGDAYNKTWYDCISELLGGIGYFAGVPAKTMMRGVKNAWHWFNKVTGANVFADDGSVVDSAVESVAERFRGNSGSSDSGSESSTATSSDSAEGESKQHEGPSGKYIKGYEAEAEKIASSVADKTGEEREKATWKKVSDYIKEQEGASVEELVAQGKLNVLEEYGDMYTGAGNSDAYFDEMILKYCKSEFKKTINYDQTKGGEWRQTMMRHFMTEHGMTDEDVSAMVYKSETAKDLKVAMRIGDQELIQESLMPLAQAGLTQEDLDKLWNSRNRVDLKKYKDKGGRYADKLKSMGTFIWPTEGVVTSHFGARNAPTAGASSNHPSIDIGASQGTPVVAADGGVVIYAGNNGGYGNSVGIKHDNGMVTYYNHLYAWNVKVGDTVGQGQQIAQVGSTGISTGPHLDFKILDKNGKPVDPEKYLN